MKKIKYLLTIVISVFILFLSTDVYAASAGLSVSSNSVYVGDSFTVTVNMNAAGAWELHVSADGPVSGCSINQSDSSGDLDNEGYIVNVTKPFSAKCTATGEGTISISLSGNVSSENSDHSINTSNVSGSQTVTVTKKPEVNPVPTQPVEKPTNNNNNNNNNNNSNSSNDTKEEKPKEETKSNNNKLKKLTIEDYELKKIDDNNYELTVDNDVTMIVIKAETADSKATITGNGVHEINVGENKIELIITAENGSKNKIIIKVTREEAEDIVTTPKKNKTTSTPTKTKSQINIISIIMIGLNIILAIAVIALFIKNKKLKDSINK